MCESYLSETSICCPHVGRSNTGFKLRLRWLDGLATGPPRRPCSARVVWLLPHPIEPPGCASALEQSRTRAAACCCKPSKRGSTQPVGAWRHHPPAWRPSWLCRCVPVSVRRPSSPLLWLQRAGRSLLVSKGHLSVPSRLCNHAKQAEALLGQANK